MATRKVVSQETRDALLDTELKYIGQRLAGLESSVSQISADAKAYAVMQFDIAAMQERLTVLTGRVDKVPSEDRTARLESAVYGTIKVIGGSFLLAVCALVYKATT